MQLETLELYRFRNLVAQQIDFTDRVNLFVGRNGQGKTSILEAVFVLSHAKSFRTSKMSDLVQWNSSDEKKKADSFSYITGQIRTDSGRKKLRCEIENSKRKVFLNDTKVTSASGFYGQLTSVVFTPDELQLVKGAPALRRKFIDRTLAMVDKAYVDSLVAYQRALKSRNHLLLQMKRQGGNHDQKAIAATLVPWDNLIVNHGLIIASKRSDLLKELDAHFISYYRFLSSAVVGDTGADKVADERISFEFESDFFDGEAKLLSREDLLELYRSSHMRDLRLGSTKQGVHRDDLIFLLDSGYDYRPARNTASQGQVRSIALSLKLSSVEYLFEKTSELPVLLLDDVESELDSSRKQAFYELLSGKENQVIITATEVSQAFKTSFSEAGIKRVLAGRI